MAATLDVTGRTRVYGCIADPIDHVRAPMVFNPLFEDRGIDAVMVPVHVAPDRLGEAVAGLKAQLNFGGMAVTVPHKLCLMELCDEVGRQGQLVGAVNAVKFDSRRRMIGDNFDGAGFVAGMRAEGYEVGGRSVLQLGAGGAGRAIAFALADAGVSRLVIHNRTREKAEELASAVLTAYPEVPVSVGDADPDGCDILVNTTSIGLHSEDPLPLDGSLLRADLLVAEIIMIPERTKLLEAAIEKGAKVHYGRHMLDHQIELIGEFLGCFP
ncbi:shikimate dehydrogenase [Nisaea acidiphila]|uniref:shikimate dehydrogenase (NADP(+)) n=1 Tax=Nisaea acidiphila TaxID=1862145 RepID=A0A9J7AX39_9PROT|nr:shikimate dehydrogenase [Nisaea acidiphila]UUX50021.1 shikimate dehydrogenase [Nisaea acidiphila]